MLFNLFLKEIFRPCFAGGGNTPPLTPLAPPLDYDVFGNTKENMYTYFVYKCRLSSARHKKHKIHRNFPKKERVIEYSRQKKNVILIGSSRAVEIVTIVVTELDSLKAKSLRFFRFAVIGPQDIEGLGGQGF